MMDLNRRSQDTKYEKNLSTDLEYRGNIYEVE